jgi:hypothetical protein
MAELVTIRAFPGQIISTFFCYHQRIYSPGQDLHLKVRFVAFFVHYQESGRFRTGILMWMFCTHVLSDQMFLPTAHPWGRAWTSHGDGKRRHGHTHGSNQTDQSLEFFSLIVNATYDLRSHLPHAWLKVVVGCC